MKLEASYGNGRVILCQEDNRWAAYMVVHGERNLITAAKDRNEVVEAVIEWFALNWLPPGVPA